MEKWDDAMVDYPSKTKQEVQRVMYDSGRIPAFDIHNPPDLMCSEAIILLLQTSFFEKKKIVPNSLKLDPKLCPPSTFLFSFEKDVDNFEILGVLGDGS